MFNGKIWNIIVKVISWLIVITFLAIVAIMALTEEASAQTPVYSSTWFKENAFDDGGDVFISDSLGLGYDGSEFSLVIDTLGKVVKYGGSTIGDYKILMGSSGKLELVDMPPGAITGLNDYEVLVGSTTGIVQYPGFQWSDALGGNILYIGGTAPQISVAESPLASSINAGSAMFADNTGQALEINYQNIRWSDDDGGSVEIFKTDDNLGNVYSLYLPADQGAANTFLKNDGSGNLTWNTITASGLLSLTDNLIVYGDVTGGPDQELAFYYDETFDLISLISSTGGLYVDNGAGNASLASYNAYTIQNGSSMAGYYYDRIEFYNGTEQIIINRPTSPTGSWQWYLPNSQGIAGSFLTNDGSGNLSWSPASGEANTGANLGGGLDNYDSKSGVSLRFNTFNSSDFNLASNLISIDYTNGQSASGSNKGFLTSADWTTFNNKVSFNITSQSSETNLDNSDELPLYDVSETAINKTTAYNLAVNLNRPEVFRNHGYTYFSEFINTVGTSAGGNEVVATNSGTGAGTSNTSAGPNRPGQVRSTTGTTATGRTSPSSASNAIIFGGGTWVYEMDINISTLSTSTERFQILLGFFDVQSGVNQTDGIYILYDEGGVTTGSAASANWQIVTSSNSTRTFTTSSTAVATGWVNLRIEVNAAASSVTYYVDGASLGTHTTNIPSGSSRAAGFGWLLIKSAGTTARGLDVDYLFVESTFSAER